MKRPLHPCLAVSLAASLAAPAGYELLALTDDPAPATGGGTSGVYQSFLGQAAVNPTSGDLVMRGQYELPGIIIEGAIWELGAGTSSLLSVARKGDPAPGVIPATTMNVISHPFTVLTGPVNSSGTTAFLAETVGGLRGIWSGDSSSGLTLVALEGGSVTPVGGGAEYNVLGEPALNDSGTVALRATMQGGSVTGSDDTVILAGTPGSLAVVAREGSGAPGTPAGTIFNNTFLDPLIDAAGNVCFNAGTTGPSPDFDLSSGIWAGPPAAPVPLVLQGDAAPGLTAGTVFGSFGTDSQKPSWTGSQLVFGNAVNDNGTFRVGVWAGTPGSLTFLAATGLNAPGTSLPLRSETSSFNRGIIGNPVMSASGHVAFAAKLDPSHPSVTTNTDDIICYGPVGNVQIILRAGDQAPGFPPGTTVKSIFHGNPFEMAPDGRLVFTMTQSASSSITIFVANPDGSIDLVATKDVALDDGGVTYTMDNSNINVLSSGQISSIFDRTGYNGSDGRPCPFGPNGELVFTANVDFAGSTFGENALIRFTKSVAQPVIPTLTILTGVPGPNDVQIQIDSVSGQTYTLNRSIDLDQSDPWSPVQSGIPGSGVLLMVNDLGALSGDDAVFYQAETTIP